MKKLLLSTALVLFACVVFSQATKATFPVKQTLGSKQTIVVSSGGFQADSAFILPAYADTTRANLGANAKYYPGDLIRTGDSIWVRNSAATKWLLIFSSSKSAVDTIWRTAGNDSIQFTIGGRYHAIKDSVASAGGGSTYYLSNAGIGHRLAITNTDSVKTLFVKTPLTADSTTNARAITIGMDTTLWHSTAYHNTLYVPVGRSLIKGYGIANTLGDLSQNRTVTFDSTTVFPNLLATISLTQNAGSNSWNAVSRILNIAPGSTFYNSNIGSGYRLAVPNSNSIKTLFGSGIITIDSTTNSNALTIIGTEVDGSITNEIQTVANTSTTTNHTVTLSNTGGSLRYEEGTGINLTTTGTTLDGVLTITAVDPSTTNELQTISVSGTTTGITTLSNSGGTMTIAGGGINSIGVAGSTITVTGTEVDGSITNEIQHFINTSNSTSHTLYISDSSGNGSLKYQEGGGISLTTTGTALNGILKITAADSSASNEMQNLFLSGSSSQLTLNLIDANSNDYGNLTITAGTGITLDVNLASNASGEIVISADPDGDGDSENELQTLSASGTTSPSIDLSLGGGSVGFASTGIISLNQSGGTITIVATEVDGSITNELQALSTSGTTSPEINLSGGGGTVGFASGGIISLNNSGGTITISATETDGSTTNELQDLTASGTTSPSINLSDGGGSVGFASSGIISLNQSGGTITIGATEVDGSTTNEIQTFSSSGSYSTLTWTLASGGSLTLNAGTGISFDIGGDSANPTITINGYAPQPIPGAAASPGK